MANPPLPGGARRKPYPTGFRTLPFRKGTRPKMKPPVFKPGTAKDAIEFLASKEKA